MTTIWFQHREHAQDTGKLRMIAIAQKLPPDDYAAIAEGRFTVVPNTTDDRGGYLVIIGSPPSASGGNESARGKRGGILSRLFGSPQVVEEGNLDLFTTRFADHLRRVNALGGPYTMFIERYLSGDVVSTLSAAAAEKMALTRSDSREHSFCFSRTPVSYWICTVPHSIPDAKSWFVNAYGGYTKLLERAWNSDHFRGFGCEVLVHVVFGRTEAAGWVNLTIFPVGSQRFDIKPVVPIDLLTEAEENP